MNFLEQLAAEWYEYNGYFVRRNVRVGTRDELDIVAFLPGTDPHVLHVECSGGGENLAEKDTVLREKFAKGRKHVPTLFRGMEVPPLDQYALLGPGCATDRKTLGGRRIHLYESFLSEILGELKDRRASSPSTILPETLPMLRTLSMIVRHRKQVLTVLRP